jgi:hypothetical protein
MPFNPEVKKVFRAVSHREMAGVSGAMKQTMEALLCRFSIVSQLRSGNDVHGPGAFVDSARRPCQKYSSCDGGPCCH